MKKISSLINPLIVSSGQTVREMRGREDVEEKVQYLFAFGSIILEGLYNPLRCRHATEHAINLSFLV